MSNACSDIWPLLNAWGHTRRDEIADIIHAVRGDVRICYERGAVEDNRRFPRFIVSGVEGKVSFAAYVEILNLSLGGVALKADRRLELGQEYNLRLEVDGRFVEIKGIAVWSKLTGIRDGNASSVPEYSAGFRFTNVLNDRVEDLIQFIETNKGDEEERVTGVRFQIQSHGRALLDTDAPCEVRLISRSGMLIRSERRYDVDRIYPMEIAPANQEAIRFKGRIASQFEVTQGFMTRYDLGVEFTDITDENRARLSVFIDSMSDS
jgi:hypothetical protein